MKQISRKLALMTLIASTYSLLTVILGSLSYSWLQIRVSESLTPFPFIFGFPAVVGLTLGCVIANLFSPIGMPDMIFGPLLTLFAAFLSWKINFGKKFVACIYPVVVNALGVSAYVSIFFNVPYWLSFSTIFIGEFIAAVLIGYPLTRAIEKTLKH